MTEASKKFKAERDPDPTRAQVRRPDARAAGGRDTSCSPHVDLRLCAEAQATGLRREFGVRPVAVRALPSAQ